MVAQCNLGRVKRELLSFNGTRPHKTLARILPAAGCHHPARKPICANSQASMLTPFAGRFRFK